MKDDRQIAAESRHNFNSTPFNSEATEPNFSKFLHDRGIIAASNECIYTTC